MTEFTPGLDLNEQFYHEVVRPLLAAHFPGLTHSAARLGDGSEVLGFDDTMSTDHDWGIRQQLFLREEDEGQWGTAVSDTLAHHLPYAYRGASIVHFGPADEDGARLLEAVESGPVSHRLEVTTARRFFQAHLGIDVAVAWTAVEWIIIPQQRLLTLTAGRVFNDELGELAPLRQKLTYFPHDIWLYLLSCQWRRIGQEDHFVGRTGIRGDDMGSRLLAARLVHDVMMLGFLYEKRYAPYPKWFGTAFNRLECAAELSPILQAVLVAPDWQTRESHLCAAFKVLGEMHNRLKITPPLPTGCQNYYGRPFHVHTGDYAGTIWAAIDDEAVKRLPYTGSVDQMSDNTDLLSYPDNYARLRPLYVT